jgi:hypothetical protein
MIFLSFFQTSAIVRPSALYQLPMIHSEKSISPFSAFPPAMLWEKRNRALLVQFLASELISSYRGLHRGLPERDILSSDQRFFPYDWAYPYGHLNKAREYALGLKFAFPEEKEPAKRLIQQMNKVVVQMELKTFFTLSKGLKALPALFLGLEPFISACKENENLLFFLVKAKEDIDQCLGVGYLQSLLLKLHPSGLEELCEKLCDNYHHRGFYFLIPEIKRLMVQFST